MKEHTYLLPKNGNCPVCHGALIHIAPYYNCNDCLSVFKYEEPYQCGEDDAIIRLLNPKEG